MIANNRKLFPIQISSLFIGKPTSVPYGSKQVDTAIFKQHSSSAHYVSSLGVQGDEQADKKHHGGVSKAICVYLELSYSYWQTQHEHVLLPGSFGENLTLTALTEQEVCIGDRFQIGNVIVEVSQPRQPCFKLGLRNEWPELVVLARESGYTGFYLRVIQEGVIQEGMELVKIGESATPISIYEANRVMFQRNISREEMLSVYQILELSPEWKADLFKKIEKLTP